MSSPHYYLMPDRKILRIETELKLHPQKQKIINLMLDPSQVPLKQEEANWRVAIFRDEIMEWEEYRLLPTQ